MADISKIETNGTTYDIKDAEARDDISSLNDDLANKLWYNFSTTTSITADVDALDVGWTFGRINSSGVDTSITDMPNNWNYMIGVAKYSDANATIFAIRFNTGINYFYTRRKSSGTWGDWDVIA